MSEQTTTVEILLVEDNIADVKLVREALKESLTIPFRLNVVSDGESALHYLRRTGSFTNSSAVDFIILDLNLPKMDGHEVLAEIKVDKHLKQIPVTIFSTSEAKQDISRAYQLHANCYVTKPLDLERFFEAVQTICNFWLTTATLPPQVEIT